jgi:hypothetical protein
VLVPQVLEPRGDLKRYLKRYLTRRLKRGPLLPPGIDGPFGVLIAWKIKFRRFGWP